MGRNESFRISFLILTIVLIGSLFTGCGTVKRPTDGKKSSQAKFTNPSERQSQKVLIVTGDYIPYVAQSKTNKGFFSELVEKTLSYSGIEYDIQYFPWARCAEMVKSGKAWAAFPFVSTKAREKIFYFSDPIYKTKQKFYYWKDNKKIKDEFFTNSQISDFSGYVFGGTNGYWYGTRDDIEALGVKTEWANDSYALMKMLRSGRIDFFIEDELVCNSAIDSLFPDQKDKFSSLSVPAIFQDYLLLVSKDYPGSKNLLDKFNKSLKLIKNNGEFDQVLKNNNIYNADK